MRNNRYLIAFTAALGLIPVVLDTTIVTVALTNIRTALHTDVNTIQWIITGYLLSNAAVVTVGGYLANRFGRKRLFVAGIALFTLGSVLCGIAPSIGWLIALRVVQGIGGGLLLPIGAAVAFDAFPQAERAKASAVVGIPLLLAPVFGPILGGYLTDTFDWHSIFFVNVPVGAIAVLIALIVLPGDQVARTGPQRFDYLGLLLSTIGIVAIIYAFKLVTQTDPATVTAANPGGSLYGWGYWLVWVLLGTGVVTLGGFAWYSLRLSRDPALDLTQFGRRDFVLGNIIIWVSSMFVYGLLVFLPLYLESIRLPHLSAQDTGVALVPLGLGTLLGTIVAAVLYRVIGPRWSVALAAALAALSAWLLTQAIQPTTDASQLLAAAQTHAAIPAVAGPDAIRWGMFLVGISVTMVGIPVQTLALEALQGEALAKASSLLLSTKLIFSSIGVAILTTIFIDTTHARATDLAGQLQTLSTSAGGNAGASAALGVLQGQIAAQAGTWAIQHIFWLIFFGSLGIVLLSLLLPGRQRSPAPAPATPSPEPSATLVA